MAKLGHALTAKELTRMIREVDTDGDERICFSKFLQAITSAAFDNSDSDLAASGQLLRSSVYFKGSIRTDVGEDREKVGFTVFLVLLDPGYCLYEDKERVLALVERERVAGVVWCGDLTGVQQGGRRCWLSGFVGKTAPRSAERDREGVCVG
ncbi:Uncharacterized protein Fot_34502 [Forsythia ovata]|uniref:EF-hand domain-containing protein n=1 Tax=Forsythia ovata TaxID=205694 RepID=A0ABD1SKC6_9LAMI